MVCSVPANVAQYQPFMVGSVPAFYGWLSTSLLWLAQYQPFMVGSVPAFYGWLSTSLLWFAQYQPFMVGSVPANVALMAPGEI
jgi:hypothetical protein